MTSPLVKGRRRPSTIHVTCATPRPPTSIVSTSCWETNQATGSELLPHPHIWAQRFSQRRALKEPKRQHHGWKHRIKMSTLTNYQQIKSFCEKRGGTNVCRAPPWQKHFCSSTATKSLFFYLSDDRYWFIDHIILMWKEVNRNLLLLWQSHRHLNFLLHPVRISCLLAVFVFPRFLSSMIPTCFLTGSGAGQIIVSFQMLKRS